MEWEYNVISITDFKSLEDPEKLKQELDNYGSKGWELVGILHKEQEGKGWMPKLYDDVITFKRKVQ
ncbi:MULTISPECIES: DUF4177 domain-containing protein [Clostridium]|uniref:DUF4177 domain-containing protein n=1 Tax=Clostridium aquiflavi TaxID=3073603 RepID=A0ABU1EJB0_9CLOT|nr:MULTISPECIES: DUF4177 domain-containing protein [unclassified Clostridium]MDR5588024.1 DUF4177 domain-containing protein [Clostridium sp. 5N-1]NFG61717.1 DUF4177 domain-containing protein [Clostridium botulinum]NFQ08502.1 DUF4177 domain-containing protein [Clostridium botulinum]